MLASLAFFNQDFHPIDAVGVPLLDRGWLYGDLLLETIRIEKGIPLFWQDHLARMLSGARLFGLPIAPLQKNARILRQKLPHLTKPHILRITYTRGISSTGMCPSLRGTPAFFATLQETTPWKQRPKLVCSVLSVCRRPVPEYCPFTCKHGQYLASVLALQQAKKQGATEVIWQDHKGHLAETSSGNLFLFQGRNLVTPPDDGCILAGITRKYVMQLATEIGCKVKEKKITKRMLFSADAVFRTSSIQGLVGIKQVDQRSTFSSPARFYQLHQAFVEIGSK